MVVTIIIFIACIFILSWLSSRLVKTLVEIAKYLRWREFIIAFFVMAFAATLPNMFIDISAALNNMPELAFGDVIGGNLVDLTLVLAIAVLIGYGSLPAESRMVQTSAIFTVIVAALPILLSWDGNLNRIDGILLLGAFFLYSWWLFSKEERFKKSYAGRPRKVGKSKKGFLFDLAKIVFFLALLLVVSHLIIEYAQVFSIKLGISLSLVGVLIIGLGNCFPEIYFSIISARRGENWIILGDIMGAVIMAATLSLAAVVLISPFEIKDTYPFLIVGIFTVLASLVFIVSIRSNKRISKIEGMVLLFMYLLFLLVQIISPYLIK